MLAARHIPANFIFLKFGIVRLQDAGLTNEVSRRCGQHNVATAWRIGERVGGLGTKDTSSR
jgi:hypothetical protein